MSTAPKGRLRSGVPATTIQRDARDFIEAAPRKEDLPWKRPGVRDDLHVSLNVRIPERTSLVIDWLAKHLERPKRELVEEALREFAQRRLTQLGISEE